MQSDCLSQRRQTAKHDTSRTIRWTTISTPPCEGTVSCVTLPSFPSYYPSFWRSFIKAEASVLIFESFSDYSIIIPCDVNVTGEAINPSQQLSNIFPFSKSEMLALQPSNFLDIEHLATPESPERETYTVNFSLFLRRHVLRLESTLLSVKVHTCVILPTQIMVVIWQRFRAKNLTLTTRWQWRVQKWE